MKLKLWRDPKIGNICHQYHHVNSAWIPWIIFHKGGSASYFAFGPRINENDGWNKL